MKYQIVHFNIKEIFFSTDGDPKWTFWALFIVILAVPWNMFSRFLYEHLPKQWHLNFILPPVLLVLLLLIFEILLICCNRRAMRRAMENQSKKIIGNMLREIDNLIKDTIKIPENVPTEDKVKQLIYNFNLQKDHLQTFGQVSGQYAHAMKTPLSAIDIGVAELSYEIPQIFNLMNQYEELSQLDNLEEIKSRLRQLQRAREQMQLEQYLPSILKDTQIALEQASEQVRDFLNIAREEYGLDGKLTEIKLNDVISRIVRIVRATTYQSADVRFIQGEIPPFRCYGSRLATALIAITENALEAISTDGYVEISTEYHPSDKSVLISIQDTASGIPKDIQNKVWEKFFTTKKTGSGIGLSIAKDVIEGELHGEIWFESAAGKGTTFFIKLYTETFGELD